MDSKGKLLKEIQVYSFAEKEWELYLDTHPDDQNALKTHAEIVKKLENLVQEFANNYGAIQSNQSTNTNKWEWINGSWPWEKSSDVERTRR